MATERIQVHLQSLAYVAAISPMTRKMTTISDSRRRRPARTHPDI